MPEKPTSGEHKCIHCGATSQDRVLLAAEQKGKPVWVCAPCMPVYVHGEEKH